MEIDDSKTNVIPIVTMPVKNYFVQRYKLARTKLVIDGYCKWDENKMG